jgi:hypothetical protein
VYINSGSYNQTTFEKCIFSNNTALMSGGGFYIEEVAPSETSIMLTDCTFDLNAANRDGGGMYISSQSPKFMGNSILIQSSSHYSILFSNAMTPLTAPSIFT